MLSAFTGSMGTLTFIYYVATTGSDSNPGTLASPFATLSHAMTVAPVGSVIYLRGGTYYGTAIKGYVNGIQLVSATDSTFQSASGIGYRSSVLPGGGTAFPNSTAVQTLRVTNP